MRKITLADRLRYWFDNTMARGTVALIGWLFVLSMLLIFSTALVGTIAGPQLLATEEPLTFGALLWMSLLRTLDPGTMGGDEGSPLFLGLMLGVTLGGIFLVSALIGAITSGIEQRLEELRKGRSFVVEQDHIVILGWSAQIFTVIAELVEANRHRKGTCIVVLAPEDKAVMEDTIRAQVGDLGRVRVVCRTGSPIRQSDLAMVNLPAARAVIVLAPESADADTHVIKTVLAITNGELRRPEPYHIVAELRDHTNLNVAHLVGRGEVQYVQMSDLISRVIVQTSRSAGLSAVYLELLTFAGNEIYFTHEPALEGVSFGEALTAYETSVPIGIFTRAGEICLRPPMDRRIEPGDQLIVIAQDELSIYLSDQPSPPADERLLREAAPRPRPPERTLILGWNEQGPLVIHRLEGYVVEGSHVDIVADCEDVAAQISRVCPELSRQTINHHRASTTDRTVLERLPLGSYDHVIVLAATDLGDVQAADARTLVTLLHLRDIADQLGHPFSIVSEMLDIQNRDLAKVTRCDDFIVSDRIVSLMLAQIAQNRHLNLIFAELFDPWGSEIQLRPAGDYVATGQPLSFYEVTEAARRRGDVALGYWVRAARDSDVVHHGVHLNPDKRRRITLAPEDQIVVLTADQWEAPAPRSPDDGERIVVKTVKSITQ